MENPMIKSLVRQLIWAAASVTLLFAPSAYAQKPKPKPEAPKTDVKPATAPDSTPTPLPPKTPDDFPGPDPF
ncbi:MAG: pectate lyase, partial [Polyangiaceae bacterium]